MSELDQLLAYCREKERVCPVPRRWHELWEMLPEKTQLGIGWQPPLPLILAAWWEASDAAKQERLEEHLRWAADHGALGNANHLLRSLPESDWHHVGD
jgi:hypothetical protein